MPYDSVPGPLTRPCTHTERRGRPARFTKVRRNFDAVQSLTGRRRAASPNGGVSLFQRRRVPVPPIQHARDRGIVTGTTNVSSVRGGLMRGVDERAGASRKARSRSPAQMEPRLQSPNRS